MSVSVSVIVPAYNTEDYIASCVGSILNSTFQDFEILLINDGSTDGTGAVCDALKERSDKIRVFHTENRGLCAARNLGLEQADGMYISFVDGDDVIAPTMLETLVSGMTPDVQLSACRFVRRGRADVHWDEDELKSPLETDQAGIAQKLFNGGFGNYVWNKLYRSSILKEHGIRFRTGRNYIEDLFFNMDYLPHCTQGTFFESRLYCYIMNDGSIMDSFNAQACISEKFISLPRAWVYSAEAVHPLSKELETYAQSRATMFYQTVLRKLAWPDSAYIEETVNYVRQHRRTLLHYRWGFKYYLSALLLCTSYTLWAKVFRRRTEAEGNSK